MKRRYREPSIRSKIGLAQTDIALLIGTGVSALAMYEIGERSLPTWPLLKLTSIEICLNKPGIEELEETIVLEQQDTAQQLLKQRHGQCTHSIIRTKLELENMRLQFQCCLNMMHVAKLLPDVLPIYIPDKERNPKDLEWIKDYRDMAHSKLETCNTVKQQLLQIRMDALQYEADKIKELMEKAET